jgi:hypothetical protein
MIIRLTQKYKITCDRCGKEEYADEHGYGGVKGTDAVEVREISFCRNCLHKPIAIGNVCKECYKDFCELAENFFDDANKGDRT